MPFCAVAATAASAPRAQAAPPSTQTCRATALGLTFTLPSDWACEQGGTGSGPRYAGDAPGRTGHLDVYTSTLTRSAPLSEYAAQLVARVRQHFARAGTGLTVTRHNTRIGRALPALRVAARYNGVWLQGAGETGEITHVFYFFVRDRLLYEFDYSAVTPWAMKDLAMFAASAKSIHFVVTA